jgi:hypothetical protein
LVVHLLYRCLLWHWSRSPWYVVMYVVQYCCQYCALPSGCASALAVRAHTAQHGSTDLLQHTGTRWVVHIRPGLLGKRRN